MKKFLSIFLVMILLFSMSIAVSAQDTGSGDTTPGTSESSESPLDTSDLGAFLVSFFKAILKNVKNISAEDMLKLPANAMADVTTFIFQILQLFGKVFGALTGAIGG